MKLSKNIIYNILYRGFNTLYPLITSFYISRTIGTLGIGYVNYAQNIVSYFVVFANFGLQTYATREIAKVEDDKEKKSKLFSQLITIEIITTLFSSVAYLALIFSFSAFSKYLTLYLATGILLFLNFINVDWFYQGIEDYRYITLRSIVIKSISLVAIIAFVKSPSDYIIYALISSLATGGNYVFNVIHLRRYVSFRIVHKNFKSHFVRLLPFLLLTLLSTIYSKLDVTMIGAIQTKEYVAYYAYAYRIIVVVLDICNAATAVFLPRLSNCYLTDRSYFYNLLKKGTNAISFFVLPMAVGLLLIAKPAIVLLYGKAFSPSIMTIEIFVPLVFINSYGDLLCYQVAMSTGNEKIATTSSLIATLMNVTLNALLIPRYFQNGAAVASVISELFRNCFIFILLKNKINCYKFKCSIKKEAIGTIAMGCAVYFVLTIVDSIFLQVILGILIGAFVYILIEHLLKNELALEIENRIRTRISQNNI